MTALIYEIIYVWTVAVGLISLIFPKIGIETGSLTAVFLTLIIAALIPVL